MLLVVLAGKRWKQKLFKLAVTMKLWKVLARNSHVYNNGIGQEIPVVKAHKVPTIELHGKYVS